jgi:hypothetical protein
VNALLSDLQSVGDVRRRRCEEINIVAAERLLIDAAPDRVVIGKLTASLKPTIVQW